MVWTAANPVADDEATKTDDYDAVWDNVQALAEARIERYLGGTPEAAHTDTAYRAIANQNAISIDGTELGNLTVQINFVGKVASGTGYIELYNSTLAAAVASSETTFTGTSWTPTTSGAITLATGVNTYYLRVKGSTTSALPRAHSGTLTIRV